MSTAIDKIKAIQETDELESIDVPRWGMTIKYRKMTSLDLGNIQKKYPTFKENPSQSALVDIIMMLARSEDGSPMFDGADDKMVLLKEPLDTINPIIIAMSAGPDLDETEKTKRRSVTIRVHDGSGSDAYAD